MGIGVFFLLKFKKSKRAFLFLYLSLGWLMITGTKWIPDLLVYGLEKQYDVLDLSKVDVKDSVFILVLGGGSTYDLGISPQDRLVHNSLARLNEGLRIHEAIPDSKLVFSGFSTKKGVTQAAITRDAAIALGVKPEDIFILEKPSTTEEEAIAYYQHFGKTEAGFILVTSDIHMPRAMYLFEKHGLLPLAAPVDHILRKNYSKEQKNASVVEGGDYISDHFWWYSHKNNFDKFSAALHEYLGLVWARI